MLLTWFEALSAWLPPRCRPDAGKLIIVSSSKARRAAHLCLYTWLCLR